MMALFYFNISPIFSSSVTPFSRFELRNSLFSPPIHLTRSTRRKCTALVSGLPTNNSTTSSSIKSFNGLIESLINEVDLSESEAEGSLDFLLNEANEALISAFLVLFRAKGETYEEILAKYFLEEDPDPANLRCIFRIRFLCKATFPARICKYLIPNATRRNQRLRSKCNRKRCRFALSSIALSSNQLAFSKILPKSPLFLSPGSIPENQLLPKL